MTIHAAGLVPSFRPTIQGLVNGGQARAVVGARVYVLQVNSSPFTDSSISLLDSSTSNPPDSAGNYVQTNEFGGFSIAGHYTCTSGRQVYVYARGGNSGGDGENPAIGLMASLGKCPESGNFDTMLPFIFVNEVSTVTAAYVFAESASDATHINSSPSTNDAETKAADLANIATGFAYSELPSKPDTRIPKEKIHTLANILSACVNSNSPTSEGCRTLFANARSQGKTGTAPEDTATAAINIARNPHANVRELFSLQPGVSAPFMPALDSAPDDFVLPVAPEKPETNIAFSVAPQ